MRAWPRGHVGELQQAHFLETSVYLPFFRYWNYRHHNRHNCQRLNSNSTPESCVRQRLRNSNTQRFCVGRWQCNERTFRYPYNKSANICRIFANDEPSCFKSVSKSNRTLTTAFRITLSALQVVIVILWHIFLCFIPSHYPPTTKLYLHSLEPYI